ncbi:MAG: tyrosine-protein phosphatase [Clostridia bacterium]|nr:tyrosine-protein phosphatase [Clostridia bacterium]
MINNFRDLGGIPTKDGRHFKKGIYYRSALLRGLSPDEKDYIFDQGIRTVIDLRADAEVARKPDDEIPHVAYMHFPVQKETEQDRYGKLIEQIKAEPSKEKRWSMIPNMGDLYSEMLTNDFSRTNLRAIVNFMINYQLGAIDFHCASGKDRTGMLTATLLLIAGVSREEIMKDYMLSLDYAETEALEKYNRVISLGGDEHLAHLVHEMFLVKEEYMNLFFDSIDKHYKNDDNYVRQFLRLNDADIEKYRNKVLE